MNIVFMGSGRFGIPVLELLCNSSKHRVIGVITAPDKPAGRGQELKPTPVKEAASAKNLHLLQPRDVNAYEFIRELNALSPDVLVVAAYGQKLTTDILSLPRYYAVNVHPSLLPKYRGASPVVQTIINGDPYCGVSIIRVTERVDGGPILGQVRIPTPPDVTAGELEEQLAKIGGELLLEVLDKVEAGTCLEVPQNDKEATWARRFQKEDARVDWRKTPKQIADFVRAMAPSPGAFTSINNARVKIWKVKPIDLPNAGNFPHGVIADIHREAFFVSCTGGAVAVLEVQPESRDRMPVSQWLNSRPIKVGDVCR